MARPPHKLADALDVLYAHQTASRTAIRSTDLTRLVRERLETAGLLRKVMRGWYIASRPDEATGDSTAWYASFWGFCAEYLTDRFGEKWIIGPEQSLLLHAGNRTVPNQLLVRAKGGRNNPTGLIHGTSILDTNSALPPASDQVVLDEGARAYRCEPALILVSAQFYIAYPTDARAVLASQTNTSDLLARLLEGGALGGCRASGGSLSEHRPRSDCR